MLNIEILVVLPNQSAHIRVAEVVLVLLAVLIRVQEDLIVLVAGPRPQRHRALLDLNALAVLRRLDGVLVLLRVFTFAGLVVVARVLVDAARGGEGEG